MKKTIIFIFMLWIPLIILAQDDPIAIIVHPSNPVNSLSMDRAVKIFKMEERFWPDGKIIVVLIPGEEGVGRARVLDEIYTMSEAGLNRFLLDKVFRGEIPFPPEEINSPGVMKRFVSAVPNAIGIVRASEVDNSVKVVLVDGKKPGQEGYRLR